ncbi:class I adenylate-forming enzyme family protein [Amycolatopsis umgeniensis]|uniref:Long-chain acyl-CoA synthetase n=1 Tax=Amycolatopsis umgeniensis TaxID=336628 RepID=A0A841B9W9_9PSEU|nr:long-chain acyl-CoA synthetase [Amycolatopsis umgeniensis]
MRTHLWSPWRSARHRPDRVAVIADDEQCDFGWLARRADLLGQGLRDRGLPEGSMLSTDLAAGPRFFALALAALRYGYGLFPIGREDVESPLGPPIMVDLDVVLHVTDTPITIGVPPSACPVVLDDELVAKDVPDEEPSCAAGYLAYVTSGTTGVPQAVFRARPHRSYRGVAVDERYGAGPEMGPHLMANANFFLGTLGPALYALQAGSAVVVQRNWSADTFIRLIDEHGVDSAFLSPDHLLDVAAAGLSPRHRPRVVFHGGASCPPAMKRTVIRLLGPVLHEYYGTSKSVLTEITTPEWLERPGSVGRALPGIRLEIRNQGRAVPDGEIGEICAWLRAVDQRTAQEALLHTGDAGFLDADGYLSIIGRAAEPRLLPGARLEHEIRLLPGVVDVVVLGDRRPVCFVEIGPDPAPGPDGAVAEAAARLGFECPEVILEPAGALPRTTSGKIRRAALESRAARIGR